MQGRILCKRCIGDSGFGLLAIDADDSSSVWWNDFFELWISDEQ